MILVALIGLIGCEESEKANETTTERKEIGTEDQELLESAIEETPYIKDIVTEYYCGSMDDSVMATMTINDINGFAMSCDFLTNFVKVNYPEVKPDVIVEFEEGDDFLSWHTTNLETGFLYSGDGTSVSDVAIKDLYDYENSTEEETEEPEPEITTGEANALERALSYLEYTAFSKKGLRDQLEYDGFEKSEIDYAIKNCKADWKEQAVKKAESYLEYQSFSKSELYDQLIYEGFTEEQAQYGVDEAYD